MGGAASNGDEHAYSDHERLVRLDTFVSVWVKAHDAAQVEAAREAREKETEVQRRLSELNHAHEQAVEKERDYVRVDTFDVAMRDVRSRHDDLTELTALRFTAIEKGENQGIGRRGAIDRVTAGIIASVAAAVPLVVLFATHTIK
jgi:hypothetical protein